MSGDAKTSVPPPVIWAQKYNIVSVTICLEDCKKPDVKLLKDSIYFKGTGGTDKKEYEVTINLYEEIDPEKSTWFVRGRTVELVLCKANEGPFWPHLTREKVKHHWLKFDFNKWRDEDDSSSSDLEDEPAFLKNLYSKFNKDKNDTAVNNEESDSDDEELPPLY